MSWLGLHTYVIKFWWNMEQVHVLYVQRFLDALLIATSGRERPLCDCPKLASILDKWAPSRRKPFLLLVRPSNPRQINLDHWQCGTNITKTIHSERLIIFIIQRNHKNVDRNQDPGDVSIYGHATWRNFITMF